MLPVKRKAFAYITHGGRLLIFRHPHAPEAGIQVPAGTVRDGETPEAAATREAAEETGLDGLVFDCFLGEQTRDMSAYGRDEMHHRFFYHPRCTVEPPEWWENHEPDPADGGDLPLFELFWARLPDEALALIVDHGAFLPHLFERLRADGALPDSR